MAKRSVSFATVTTVAFADTTNLVDTQYPTVLQGGSGTQKVAVTEVFMGGQSSSTSQPQYMILSRDTTVAATAGSTTTTDAPLDAATAALALPPLVGNAWTTKPQRSATAHLLVLPFNAYGGVARWLARDRDQEITIVGNTQPLGEVSLSAFTGTTGGAIGGHMIYEPY